MLKAGYQWVETEKRMLRLRLRRSTSVKLATHLTSISVMSSDARQSLSVQRALKVESIERPIYDDELLKEFCIANGLQIKRPDWFLTAKLF